VADPRENGGAKPSPVEVDRFEHVLASPDKALLRLNGSYVEVPGPRTLEAVLVVDDGESVRRHLALPDPNRLDGELLDDEWFWQTAFVVSSACLRDQRTAFALEPEPGVLMELPWPLERLVPERIVSRGGRVAPKQAVALGLALTIALSSTAFPALADTHVLNVQGPDGQVTQMGRDGTPVQSASPTMGAASSAPAAPAAAPQPDATAATDTTQQPQTPAPTQDTTTPTPSTD
jgi:hypothetical protein